MLPSILKTILIEKKKEIADLYQNVERDPQHPIRHLTPAANPHLFSSALLQKRGRSQENGGRSQVQIIAEIKRRSPSLGVLSSNLDPLSLAETYVRGGAAALSVLTDPSGFGGSIGDLAQVVDFLGPKGYSVPVLRKDFIADPIQIAEARVAGASAVLLIASIFQETPGELRKLLETTESLGLEALVEIHSEIELDLALDSGAKIIGVNQRNLNTFQMHPELFDELSGKFPSSVIRVAESGIKTPADIARVKDLGYHAALVGESLVKSEDPEKLLKEYLR